MRTTKRHIGIGIAAVAAAALSVVCVGISGTIAVGIVAWLRS